VEPQYIRQLDKGSTSNDDDNDNDRNEAESDSKEKAAELKRKRQKAMEKARYVYCTFFGVAAMF
jgi:hypothetical protein